MSPAHDSPGALSILAAAIDLFSEHGYDAVSMAQIADAAGVSKANVFHHFNSKEALYLQVMQAASAEHADYAERLASMPGESRDKVRQLVEFEVQYLLDHPKRTRLLLRELSDGGNPRVGKLARKVFQRNFSAVVAIFEQGRSRGEFLQSMDCAAAAMLLGGAAQTFFYHRATLREFRAVACLESPSEYAARIATLLLAGVVRSPADER